MSSGRQYDSYTCTRCNKEVAWYETGDAAWRDWEHQRKVCSACRELTMTAEEREAMLPRPAAPCACGSTEFLRAPLREHVGESATLASVHTVSSRRANYGELYVLACRGCGLAQIYVRDVGGVLVDAALGTDVVRLKGPGPYR